MTATQSKAHPFPDRILLSGVPAEYPTSLISTSCELTIVQVGSGFDVIEADGEVLEPSRPATRDEIASCMELTPAMAHSMATGRQVADPIFEVDDRIVPGPDSTLSPPPAEPGVVKARFFCHGCHRWHYVVDFGGECGVAKMLEPRMRPASSADVAATDEPGAVNEAAPDGWQGTEPAEGTRRALIRDTIVRTSEEKLEGTGRSINSEALAANALELADEIEGALLRDTILAEQIEEDRGQRNGIEGEDDDGRVHVTAGDGSSVGSLEVVLGAGDGAPYISLVDLEHLFANLYEDITERQAKDGEGPTDEAPQPGAVEEVELDLEDDLSGPVRSLLASIFGRG